MTHTHLDSYLNLRFSAIFLSVSKSLDKATKLKTYFTYIELYMFTKKKQLDE